MFPEHREDARLREKTLDRKGFGHRDSGLLQAEPKPGHVVPAPELEANPGIDADRLKTHGLVQAKAAGVWQGDSCVGVDVALTDKEIEEPPEYSARPTPRLRARAWM